MTARVGFAAALAAAAEVFLFAVFLVLALFWPAWNAGSFVVCFLLAPTVIVMMTALHQMVPPERKIWTRIALAFSVIYAAFCTLTYFVQLVFVLPNEAVFPPEMLRVFQFAPGTFLFAVDMLGYGFLCLATLFAAGTFQRPGDKVLKILYVVHGAFALPTLVFPGLPVAQDTGAAPKPDAFGSTALLFWCAFFIPLSLLTAEYFRKHATGGDRTK